MFRFFFWMTVFSTGGLNGISILSVWMRPVRVEGTVPWGGTPLLPWGRLREPVQHLKRASAIVVTRRELIEPPTLMDIFRRIEKVAPGVPVFSTRFETTLRRASGEAVSHAEVKG